MFSQRNRFLEIQMITIFTTGNYKFYLFVIMSGEFACLSITIYATQKDRHTNLCRRKPQIYLYVTRILPSSIRMCRYVERSEK